MSTWKGVSHARMSRATEGLRPTEYKVLGVVRRLIPDGTKRKISQAEIAKKAGVSEGTVSRALRSLDGLYLLRHFLGKGRGRGYALEVLPPPERREPTLDHAPQKGSMQDPSLRSFESGDTTPQTPSEKGSLEDVSILYDHAHEQQQQRGGLPEGEYGQLDPETVRVLSAENAHRKVINRIAQVTPKLTAKDVQENLTNAKLREVEGSIGSARGVLFDALAAGQKVAPPRKRPDHPDAPPGGAPPASPPSGQRGRRVPEPPTDIPHEEPDPIWALVRQLAPDAVPKERQLLAEWLLSGMPPEQALAELERERQDYVQRMTMPRGARPALARLT